MGKYDGMSGAPPPTKTGTYFMPGNYRVKIKAVKWVDGQVGKQYTVVETEVLESNNPEITVGTERSWVVSMGNVMTLINLKAFLAAASGVDPEASDAAAQIETFWQERHPDGVHADIAQIMEEYVVKHNVLENLEMLLECVTVKKKDGEPFTKHVWSSVVG